MNTIGWIAIAAGYVGVICVALAIAGANGKDFDE